MAMTMPETQYAKTDDGVYLAYQIWGEGPGCFLGLPPIISNIEVAWEWPETARFMEEVGKFCRFLTYDKRGQGMSDRVDEVPTLERRAADTLAVMYAAGVERAVLGGISEGGSTAALVAATHPDRVSGLAMFGSFSRVIRTEDYPIGVDDARFDSFCEMWMQGWGTPETISVYLLAPDRVGDPTFTEFVNRLERQSSTPRGLLAQLQWAHDIDIRGILPVISVPTTVMHRTGDRLIGIEHGQWLGAQIQGARFVELAGSEHVPYLGDHRPVIAELRELLTGDRGPELVERVLATVVFTDIVASTERVSELGDQEWKTLLDRHDAMAERTVARHGGRIVKTTGDGLLATFDGPARGLRCAKELVHSAAQIGLPIRAGAHTGEVELRGDDVAGIAVHIGARVAAEAEAGEVLVSRTVTDLVTGSGATFEDRGLHELKGLPERWQLYRVLDA